MSNSSPKGRAFMKFVNHTEELIPKLPDAAVVLLLLLLHLVAGFLFISLTGWENIHQFLRLGLESEVRYLLLSENLGLKWPLFFVDATLNYWIIWNKWLKQRFF
jgi:hypothetical protein